MKKKAFLLVAMVLFVACMLAFGISANAVTTEAEFKSALTSGVDGEYDISGDIKGTSECIEITHTATVVFNLTGDTIIDDNLTFKGDANVIFNLNGYNLNSTRTGSGNEYQGFLLVNSQNCSVTFNGVKEADGTIRNTVTSTDLLAYCHGGTITCKNVNVSSGEEMFYTKTASLSTAIQLDGGTYTVRSGDPFINCKNVGKGTYFKNCTLVANQKKIEIDDNCTDAYRNSVYGGTGYEILFENVDMAGFTIISGTSLQSFVFKDLVNNLDSNTDNDFTLSSVTLGSDRHKSVATSQAVIINSPSCMNEGSSTIKTYNAQTPVTTVLEKTAHIPSDNIANIVYDSYLSEGVCMCTCQAEGCTALVGGKSAPALFTYNGYSTPEDDSVGLTISFEANLKAIELYELKSGKTISYGIVAAAKSCLGDNNPLDENGNAVILDEGNVVKAEVGKEFYSYDFKLINMEGYEETELVLATYVITTEGEGEEATSSVVYLQDKQLVEGLGVVSYDIASKKIA